MSGQYVKGGNWIWHSPAVAGWMCESCVVLHYLLCFETKESAPVSGLLAVPLMNLNGYNRVQDYHKNLQKVHLLA